MIVDHIISKIYNLRILEITLIVDSTTLLDYRQSFIGGLHEMDSKSHT